jgi:hypothetical protein
LGGEDVAPLVVDDEEVRPARNATAGVEDLALALDLTEEHRLRVHL